jgi:hypothetical protein
MKLTLSAGLCALLFAGASLIGGYAQAASSLADVITSAVADPARPEGDRNRDVARKPVESLQFSGVKPGDTVADFNASAGYFTRLFSDVVGSRGHVYAIEPVLLSQTPTPTPAMHDGQHDFDFNIGVWHTHIKRILQPLASSSESVELNGTVTVRKVWDGKAELEEIEADGPKGHWEGLTLFLYNPSAHQWSQSFANSKVGTLSSKCR